MRALFLKLALAAAVLGLVGVQPPRADAQSPMFMATARRTGMFSSVNIFAPPFVQLNVNPRGPQFGFNMMANFFPSVRARSSPFGQQILFTSSSATQFSFSPSTGPIAQGATPAFLGFSFTPLTGMQTLAVPSQLFLSNGSGMFTALNTATPQFLTGNLTFSVPVFTGSGLFFLKPPAASSQLLLTTNPSLGTGATTHSAVTTGTIGGGQASGNLGPFTIIRPNGMTTFIFPDGTVVPMPLLKTMTVRSQMSSTSNGAIRGPVSLQSAIPPSLIMSK